MEQDQNVESDLDKNVKKLTVWSGGNGII